MHKSIEVFRLVSPLAITVCVAGLLVTAGCTTSDDRIRNLDPVLPAAVLEAPEATEPRSAAYPEEQISRGKYLVDLLGCGMCHTDGALFGTPDERRNLAGSHIGLAYSNPMEEKHPGVIYPANLTPDAETGIGGRTASDIALLLRSGEGNYRRRLNTIMPWPAYARVNEDDALAIATYLLSLPPVSHRVPDRVKPGQRATAPYVHFGIYHDR